MAWDEGGSDGGIPAWHQSLAYHDLSVESGIQSAAIFSATWCGMVLLLLYIHVCSSPHPFFSHVSCGSILCLWRRHCDYSHLFSPFLWTGWPANALAKQENSLAQ